MIPLSIRRYGGSQFRRRLRNRSKTGPIIPDRAFRPGSTVSRLDVRGLFFVYTAMELMVLRLIQLIAFIAFVEFVFLSFLFSNVNEENIDNRI